MNCLSISSYLRKCFTLHASSPLLSQLKRYHPTGNSQTFNGCNVVDMRSDTVTSPSPSMRKAMAQAATGDDVYGEDPSVNELESRMADITGKEAALFVPSGTMGNLISILSHCSSRGSEVLLGDASHIFLYEQGGVSQFGGVHVQTVPTDPLSATLRIEEIISRVKESDIHNTTTELLCLENTHCSMGGRVVGEEYFHQIHSRLRPLSIPIHLDGARLFNAVAANYSSPEEVRHYLKHCASASLCLSKGLGCPVGSLVVGERPFIQRCRRLRKAVGGGMRQAGVLAAAANHILKGDFIAQLKTDHQNAILLRNELLKYPELFSISSPVDSNMVILELRGGVGAQQFAHKIQQASTDDSVVVLCFPWSDSSLRLVTHCSLDSDMTLLAAEKIIKVALLWHES